MSCRSNASGACGLAGILLAVLVAAPWGMPKASASGASADTKEMAAESSDIQHGGAVYGTYCAVCHQMDGRGLGGTLAGDFVGDSSRLAKSDAELLEVIRDGRIGTVGAMPPWSQSLSEQEMVDVLAFVRATFQAELAD
ncbi:MAG: cytochrome c [Deltaproteobacteria bacterium]|nr:cytochrome c [Deltaproteobacteria bacterium]